MPLRKYIVVDIRGYEHSLPSSLNLYSIKLSVYPVQHTVLHEKGLYCVHTDVYTSIHMLSGSSRWRRRLRSGRSSLQDPRASGTTDTRSVSVSSFEMFAEGTTKIKGFSMFSQKGRLSICLTQA